MKLTSAVLLLLVSVLAVAPASARCPRYRVAVLTDTSRDAHGLTGIVTRFQNGLGGENNGNHPGPIAKGFRQVRT